MLAAMKTTLTALLLMNLFALAVGSTGCVLPAADGSAVEGSTSALPATSGPAELERGVGDGALSADPPARYRECRTDCEAQNLANKTCLVCFDGACVEPTACTFVLGCSAQDCAQDSDCWWTWAPSPMVCDTHRGVCITPPAPGDTCRGVPAPKTCQSASDCLPELLNDTMCSVLDCDPTGHVTAQGSTVPGCYIGPAAPGTPCNNGNAICNGVCGVSEGTDGLTCILNEPIPPACGG
jgi:hypothetical protein